MRAGRIGATLGVAMLSAALVAGGVATGANDDKGKNGAYEVWMVDQTDTRAGFGGLLHVYDGRELEQSPATAQPLTTDLGAAASQLCLEKTGAVPTRPHMLAFPFDDATRGDYAVLSWVVSGHVLTIDAETRAPVDCVRTEPGELGRRQAHAIWPTPDGEYVMVANQNGKLLERVAVDWSTGDLTQEPAATLNLYAGTTPSGAPRQDPVLRPDNAPICPLTTRDGRLTFVSLRGGGAFVVDHNATPMRIVAEYDRAHIDDNGCGQSEARGKMFVNAGAGAPGDLQGHTVYAFDLDDFDLTPSPPNQPAPRTVYTRDGQGEVDAHGIGVVKDKYLYQLDRGQNDVTVVDVRDERILGRQSIATAAAPDPAPDLLGLAPDQKFAMVSLRGPTPLSGGHDAVGTTPGIGVLPLLQGGKSVGTMQVAPARRTDGRPPDPHAIRIRVTR